MFDTISWSTYWMTISVLAVLYYLVIVLLFFKNELTGLVRHSSQGDPSSGSVPQSELQENFQHEVTAFIRQSGATHSPKEEILFGLQRLFHVARFESFNKFSYKEAINEAIISECQQYCSVHLSEEDLRVLWR